MEYTQLTFDFSTEKKSFCFDDDINTIVEMVQHFAKKHNYPLGKIEFNIWDHVPHLGYRLMLTVYLSRENLDDYYNEMKEVIKFGEEHNIEVSSLSSGFYTNSTTATVYISTMFLDKRKKLKATQGRKPMYALDAA